MAIIRSWLKACDDDHPQCRSSLSGDPIQSPPALPTRVIDIQGYPHYLHLVIPGGRRAKYVAVSHCWGGHSPLRTTKSTLEEHMKQINLQSLSKTIQDAICVTHSLGIRYLWVDYLCIIQEDDEDFHRESRTMTSIYERASCTIAATAAKDGTEGCFRRDPSQALVTVRCDPDDPASGIMYFGLQYESHESMVEKNIFNGPLNQRGWVLQEHLFSRRTIHFAADQIYWECDKMFVGENHSNVDSPAMKAGFPRRSLLRRLVEHSRYLQDTLEPMKEGPYHFKFCAKVHSVWAELVRYYSRCALTRCQDKLPAILSLSLALEKILGHPFYEGHYFDDTPWVLSGLLWHTAKNNTLTRPPDNRAPSWSWISLDGEVDFPDPRVFPWHATVRDPAPTSTDLQVLRVGEHRPAGLPSCWALEVSGVALECSAHRNCCSEHECRNTRCLESIYSINGDTIMGYLEYDVADDRPCRFWIIPIYVDSGKSSVCTPIYYVLIVKLAPGHSLGDGIFQRVGMGFITDLDLFKNFGLIFMVLI